ELFLVELLALFTERLETTTLFSLLRHRIGTSNRICPEKQSILSFAYSSYANLISEDLCLQNQGQTFGFDDILDPMNVGFSGNHRSASLSDLSLKTCHCFSKECYRHGSNCRYIHGLDNCLSPGTSKTRSGSQEHGQHDVILAEDTLKYSLDNRNERNDPGQIVSGSRQIYLTFQPESTFTEEDLSDYFGYSSPTLVFVNTHLVKIYSKLLLSFVLVAISVQWKMLGSPANTIGCLDS
ncbi:Zinc finger CCCH domain-containing protein 18, partial [Bienertia sinuspersici]